MLPGTAEQAPHTGSPPAVRRCHRRNTAQDTERRRSRPLDESAAVRLGGGNPCPRFRALLP
ncbi:hypothetical protein GCM10010421_33590 [Streptomyces glaucus]|uniref:Secreted protein n=1 Tax=Streptomyces glaucus TaxID=284029 RepID=A0ABP5WYT4_9ACTN